MKEKELLRYSRHILLPDIDYEGQHKLLNACCLIVGLGGLGSAAALYLASSGVGELILCDFDTVEESNLQRQIIHTQHSIGCNKAKSAAITIQALNPNLKIKTLTTKLDKEFLLNEAKHCNVIIDCSDNFETRYLLNSLSLQLNKPLVSGSAIRTEGQVSVFNLHQNSPCYQCLYDDPSIIDDENCSNSGVIAPLVGIIGSMQANEALKILIQSKHVLDGKLFMLNSMTMQSRLVNLSKDPYCPACHSADDSSSALEASSE